MEEKSRNEGKERKDEVNGYRGRETEQEAQT